MGRRNLLLFICIVLFFIIVFLMKENNIEEIKPETLGEQQYVNVDVFIY